MNTIGTNNEIINNNNEKNYNNFKKYEKMYKNVFKDYQNLKGQFNSLKDKFRLYNQKFSGIIELYKFAIDELIKDEEFKNKKDIYINIDEISKGNFENFNKFEKYTILVFLIKHLLPLINSENNNNIYQKFNNVEINLNNNNNNKMYKTLNNFQKKNLNMD